MKKSILIIIMFLSVFIFSGCKEKNTEKGFMEKVTEAKSYKAEGVIESYFNEGRKQSDFTVLYKEPNIKVTLKSTDNDDKQIILKNSEGVYILIPTVNKNFKIQSSWPENASYPYLLQSLAKDIANETNPIIVEDEETKSIEVKTYMHKDSVASKEKIIFNKETMLPTEVLVYNENNDIFIRVVFNNIELDSNISDSEFVVEETMNTARLDFTEKEIVFERKVDYPVYYPTGTLLTGENTISSADGSEVRSIMKYTGDVGFTIVQEYVNDHDITVFQQEVGEIINVMGIPAIIKTNAVSLVYNGVEYTVASSDISKDEMIKIVSSYMTSEEK